MASLLLTPKPPETTQAPTHFSTGSARLDGLLGGGYPAGSATLLYGPPYTGKQTLLQCAFVAAAVRGPATMLLHGVSADLMSQRLRRLDPRMAEAEAAGRVTYVDMHSQAMGEPTSHPNALYVEDAQDASGLSQALSRCVGAQPGLLAVQSVSTLLLDLGASQTFKLLRNTVGRVQRAGGVGLLTLQAGMHAEHDVQMAKHVCGGMVELRRKGDIDALHVEGLETTVPRPGWVEYEATARSFRLTGSFSTRTIP